MPMKFIRFVISNTTIYSVSDSFISPGRTQDPYLLSVPKQKTGKFCLTVQLSFFFNILPYMTTNPNKSQNIPYI